jgi:hypothetical protein
MPMEPGDLGSATVLLIAVGDAAFQDLNYRERLFQNSENIRQPAVSTVTTFQYFQQYASPITFLGLKAPWLRYGED